MQVRAKFRCNSAVEAYGSKQVTLTPVSPGVDASEEDKAFWDATPNGSLTMYVSNDRAAGFFEPGKDYYLTFEAVQS